jgi:hypothetical protein
MFYDTKIITFVTKTRGFGMALSVTKLILYRNKIPEILDFLINLLVMMIKMYRERKRVFALLTTVKLLLYVWKGKPL